MGIFQSQAEMPNVQRTYMQPSTRRAFAIRRPSTKTQGAPRQAVSSCEPLFPSRTHHPIPRGTRKRGGIWASVQAAKMRDFVYGASPRKMTSMVPSDKPSHAWQDHVPFSEAVLALMPLLILNALLGAAGSGRSEDDPTKHIKSTEQPRESREASRHRRALEQLTAAKPRRHEKAATMKMRSAASFHARRLRWK